MSKHPNNTTHKKESHIVRYLRHETVGGVLVICTAILGFALANSDLQWFYNDLKHASFNVELLDFHMDTQHFAAEGLLAVFFFVVGLELKHEFVHGALRKASTALIPVTAAVGGVAIPAIIYFMFNLSTESVRGWALPTATDIAFAIAILGLIAPKLPTALRMFLLTLAVVDDLIAIAIIAIFYSSSFNLAMLLLAMIPLLIFAVCARKFTNFFAQQKWASWLILLPLGIIVWLFFLKSGIHATIAGVLIAFTVPAGGRSKKNLAEKLAWRFQPLSAGVAVPVFAFFATGVEILGNKMNLTELFINPIMYGVICGLVIGKPMGITITTWALTKFTRASLGVNIRFSQLLGVGAIAGVGFTVSLLIAELSFTNESQANTARIAVMLASIIASAVATVIFRLSPSGEKRLNTSHK